MKKLKVHIRQVILCELSNNKNATEIAKKMFSIHRQGVITDKFESGFQSFVLMTHY